MMKHRKLFFYKSSIPPAGQAFPASYIYYNFSTVTGGNVIDSMAHVNAAENGVPTYPDGRAIGNPCFQKLDGDGAYLDAAYRPFVNPAWSISFWFYNYTSVGSTRRIISQSENGGPNNGAYAYIQMLSGEIALSIQSPIDGTNLAYVDCAGVGFELNTWRHACFTYDGVDFKSYIDGILRNTVNAPGIYPANLGSMQVGGLWYGGTLYNDHAFRLDDLRIWDVALTGVQVAAVYTNDGGV